MSFFLFFLFSWYRALWFGFIRRMFILLLSPSKGCVWGFFFVRFQGLRGQVVDITVLR